MRVRTAIHTLMDKELALLIPGARCGDPDLGRIFHLSRQALFSSFLRKSFMLPGPLTDKEMKEIASRYQPLVGMAFSQYGVKIEWIGYNELLFQNAAALAGPFLHHPETMFLFCDPFEAMIDSSMPDKLTGYAFPILDQIHNFSQQNDIPSNRIVYMVVEGGDINKKPYDLYYEEHPELEPVRFLYYPSFESRTSECYSHGPSLVSESNERSQKFLYLNNNLRSNRIDLCARLWDKGALDKDFYWSFLKSKEIIEYEGTGHVDYLRKIAPGFLKIIPKTVDMEFCPENLDVSSAGEHRTLGGDRIIRGPGWADGTGEELFNDSYISLVSETTSGSGKQQGRKNHVFLTEKTFKCFFLKHPFIIWGYPHSLKAIRDLGYQTFSPWINEEYDDMESYQKRRNAIIQEVGRLKKLSLDQLQEMRVEMSCVLDHNAQYFKIEAIQARNQPYFERELNKQVY